MKIFVLFVFFAFSSKIYGQIPDTSTIIDVIEGDRVATIYWNSKTNIYDKLYDPDKKNKGIFSYLIEWGKESQGFTNKEITPYRAFMIQPLDTGIYYIARVYSINNYGVKSFPSAMVRFKHSSKKTDSMRNRLTGFFDDFNLPMGAFDEKKWNQSYSGCLKIGQVSQHINNQFHGHNVLSSGKCDRAVASSRVRNIFDFSNRTGAIEFELDGAKLFRNFWYLDISSATRKRDLTGHTALELNNQPPQSDPAYLLRILEKGGRIEVHIADSAGYLHKIDSMYRYNACGKLLDYCSGENLHPIPNVRRHWKIKLSKDSINIKINDILVISGSLITPYTPQGLPYEKAQVNWLFFSYNTPKENTQFTMLHWDNFGFDAPSGFQDTTVIHNYTDGILGTDTTYPGNEKSAGKYASLNNPAISTIGIPDKIKDTLGNFPIKSELMFTIQGGLGYSWSINDSIILNGNKYAFPKPSSTISTIPNSELVHTNKPYSVLMDVNPNHLTQGLNEVKFKLNDTRILNIHIELTYPKNTETHYTQPKYIFNNYMETLMNFKTTHDIGPGIVFDKINDSFLYQSEYIKVNDNLGEVIKYTKQTPISKSLVFDIIGNTEAQLAALGHSYGIKNYYITIDSVIIDSFIFNVDTSVGFFYHKNRKIDISKLKNGVHKLFIYGYDELGQISCLDAFLAHADFGEYIPIEFTVQNPPIASINSDNSVCQSHNIDFKDNSSNAISYEWFFAGGVPAYSTAPNISVNYSTPGNYIAKLIVSNPYGSDTITKNIQVLNTTSSIDNIKACKSIKWIDGKFYSSNNTTATYTLTNSKGCDSVIKLKLTITKIDTSITKNNNTLIANQSNAKYQWLDCNKNKSIITNATNKEFIPIISGDYAVLINYNNCLDTSGCKKISILSNILNANNNGITLYPNPTNGLIHLGFEDFNSEAMVTLKDINGVTIQKTYYISKEKDILYHLDELASGLYFMEIITHKSNTIFKINKY